MLTKPKLEQRSAQPYAAVRMAVPIPFGKYLQPAWDEMQRWLLKKGSHPAPAARPSSAI